MTVYVLVNKWHTEDCGDDCTITVFSSLERAEEELKKCIADSIENDISLFENGQPRENTVVEENLYYRGWSAYEDGNYLLNSVEYFIEAKEVVE